LCSCQAAAWTHHRVLACGLAASLLHPRSGRISTAQAKVGRCDLCSSMLPRPRRRPLFCPVGEKHGRDMGLGSVGCIQTISDDGCQWPRGAEGRLHGRPIYMHSGGTSFLSCNNLGCYDRNKGQSQNLSGRATTAPTRRENQGVARQGQGPKAW